MKEKLTELINKLYEAEGLVEMALRRNVEPSDRVVELIINKCCELTRMGEALEVMTGNSPVDTELDEVPVEEMLYGSVPPVSDKSEDEHEETLEEEVQKELPAESHEMKVTEEKEVEIFTKEILPNIPSSDSDITDASIFADDSSEEYKSESETEVAPEPEQKSKSVSRTASADRASSYSILSLCSINDKFRFKRELFNNSQPQMMLTFSLIEQMSKPEDVRRYCISELNWDTEGRTVKDFFAVVDRYFQK